MAEKLAVRKVKRRADGSTEVEIIDLATNKPVKDTKGYKIISATDTVKAEKPDPKKPYAVRRVEKKPDGMLRTIFVDAETGEEVFDLDKYNVVDGFTSNLEELKLLPKEEVEKAKKEIKDEEKKSGKHDDGGEYYHGLDPNSPEAKVARQAGFSDGYISENEALNIAKSMPGMIGMGAKGLDIARRLNNASVVNTARNTLGIEKKEGLGPGQVGDITIGGKNYPVGFEAEETKKEGLITRKDVGAFLGGMAGSAVAGPLGGIVGGVAGGKLADSTKEDEPKRTNLTPEEARRRQSIAKDQANLSPAQAITRNVFKDAQVDVGDVDEGETIARGMGLADLSPSFKNGRTKNYSIQNASYSPETDLESRPRDLAGVEYSLEGKGRSQKPSSGIEYKVADVVTDVLGPGYSVDVTSGQEPPGRSPVGSAYRHPLGLAADLKIKDPYGRTLDVNNPQDAQAIKDVATGMAARYNANFGMGVGYMGPETMHIDTVDVSTQPGLGQQWGGIGRAWADDLAFARTEGVMPSQYYDIDNPPTPQMRPGFGEMIAETPTEQMVRPNARASVDLTRRMSFSDPDLAFMGATLAGEIDLSKTDLRTPEGIQEARAILSTMENRRTQGKTMEDVVMSPNQYSTWNSDVSTTTALNNYKQNQSMFDSIVKDYVKDPQSNMGFTHYYNASLASPGWGQDLQQKTQIGPHSFGFLGDYQGAFGTNFSATPDTQEKVSKPTMSGAGTEARASTGVSIGRPSMSSASTGLDTTRGMGSDENADRSSSSSTSRSSSNSDRGSYSSGIGSTSSRSSSEGKGSYGSSGRSGYSSIGSSSGFGSSSSSEGKGSYGSSGRSGYSSIGSGSGFSSKSTSSSSTSKSTNSSNHGYSGSRSDGWT